MKPYFSFHSHFHDHDFRCYIDSGELDFYNHSDLCTGRCKSRTGNPSKLILHDSTIQNSPTPIRQSNGISMVPKSLKREQRKMADEDQDIKPTMEQLQLFSLLHLQPGTVVILVCALCDLHIFCLQNT